jgi:hypothetical protein
LLALRVRLLAMALGECWAQAKGGDCLRHCLSRPAKLNRL